MTRAIAVRDILEVNGFKVGKVDECCEEADGAVYMAEDVHVQVPTYGSDFVLWRVDGDDHIIIGMFHGVKEMMAWAKANMPRLLNCG